MTCTSCSLPISQAANLCPWHLAPHSWLMEAHARACHYMVLERPLVTTTKPGSFQTGASEPCLMWASGMTCYAGGRRALAGGCEARDTSVCCGTLRPGGAGDAVPVPYGALTAGRPKCPTILRAVSARVVVSGEHPADSFVRAITGARRRLKASCRDPKQQEYNARWTLFGPLGLGTEKVATRRRQRLAGQASRF